MHRGEFIDILESNSSSDVTSSSLPEEKLKIMLLESATINAQRGRKWAAVVSKAKLNSSLELLELHQRIVGLSDFAQQEGFQTDESHYEQEGYRYHQLTVFWSDGKSVYESEHLLGEFDHDLLDTAA